MARMANYLDMALGGLGVVLLIAWFGLVGYLFTLGEVETPVLLLLLTAFAFLVILWNE